MAIKIGSILIDIKADTAQLVSGMEHAQKTVEHGFERMKEAALAFTAALGIGLSIEGLVDFIKQSAETQVQIAKMSAAAGVSPESFSELAYVAKVTGTPMEALAKGLQFLDKNMVSAAAGNEKTAHLFNVLGIAITDSQGKTRDAATVFGELREKLGEMDNQGEAAGIRMKLLGRGSGELAYLMNLPKEQFRELAEEAHRFGFVIDNQSRSVLLQYEEQMNRLRLEAGGMAVQFAVGLAPALITVANAFAAGIGGAAGFRELGAGVGEVVTFIAKAALSAVTGLKELYLSSKLILQQQKEINEQSFLDKVTGKAITKVLGGSSPEQKAILDDFDRVQKSFEEGMVRLNAGLNVRLPEIRRTGAAPDLRPAEDAEKLGRELDALGEKTRKLLEREEGDKYSRLLGDINAQLQKIAQFEAAHPERIWTNLNQQANLLRAALTDVEGKQRLILNDALLASEKPILESILKTPVIAPEATGYAASEAALLKLGAPESAEERTRRRKALFEESFTPLERYQRKLQELDILYASGHGDEYDHALKKINDDLLNGIDPLVTYQRGLEKIAELQAAGASSGVINAAQFDNIQKAAKVWEDILIKQNNFSDSMRAAFLHAADDASQIGEKLFRAFTRAIDGLNQGLTDLVVGDKANFKDVFKNFAKDIFKAELEHNITGPLFGALGLGGKRGESAANPLYVMDVGLGQGMFATGGGKGGGGGLFSGILGSIFGGLFGGGAYGGAYGGGGLIPAGGDLNEGALSGVAGWDGTFASGGMISPGHWGLVGEAGPELIYGGRSGASVTPTAARGGDTFNINASGDPGLEYRIMKAIDVAENRAVRTAILASEERRMRRADR